MNPIPQASPLSSYQQNQAEIDEAVLSVLRGGHYILGENVAAFESEFADYIGVGYAVGVATGTDALFLALIALGIGAGDEVITVSHTAVATVAAIVQVGATPVFVDIDETYCMDVTLVESAITQKTKAIIPVHLYGHPVDMADLMVIAGKYGLKVVEDCAQAHGARVRMNDGSVKPVGSIGDCAAFSFYPTKNLGAFGDAGAVVTNDEFLAEKIRLLRQYGWKNRYVSSVHGWNSRMDEVQAAMLRVLLRKLDLANQNRRSIAASYDQHLEGLATITSPVIADNVFHVYHQYVVRVNDRNGLMRFLGEHEIGVAIHYPLPVHRQSAYAEYAHGNALPVSERVCDAILSLPMYPQLPMESVKKVVNLCCSFGG